MNNFLGIFVTVFLSFSTLAQTALHFDGQDDYVDLNSMSNVMDTVTDFTLDFWVNFNAENNEDYGVFFSCNTYDYQNVFLIRVGNDAFDPINGSAVVYVNDLGNQYISGTSNIGDNECHHIGFSYSNGVCKLYVDGSLEVTASHNINFSSTDVFSFGQEYDSGVNPTSNFYNGTLDNFRVWNISKSASEVLNLMNSNSSVATNLVLEYSFESGVSNGNNTVINSVVNSTNAMLNGALNGFGLNGSVSNFVSTSCVDTIVIIELDTLICNGSFVSPYFGTIMNGGVYQDTIYDGSDIDTIILLNLEIVSEFVDNNIYELNDSTLTSNDTLSTFQWLDCESMTPIVGETSAIFSPGNSAYYALELTHNGCVDTTGCVALKRIGLEDIYGGIEIYKDIYSGHYIVTSSLSFDNATIQLVNVNGQLILTRSDVIFPYFIPSIDSGYYIIKIIGNTGVTLFKSSFVLD